MWGANPLEAAGLCPTSLPFEFSKASRRILEKSMKLFVNTRGQAGLAGVGAAGGEKAGSQGRISISTAAGGPGSGPTLSKQSGGQGGPLYGPPLSSRALSGRGRRLLCCSGANPVHQNTQDQAAHTTSHLPRGRQGLSSVFP